MAVDIPNIGTNSEALLKGLDTGSNLLHNMMLNKYYSELHPSGDVANAMYVEQLRQKYGESDPRYLQAKQAHDLALQNRESMIGYRDTMNKTAGIRATSPLGKLIAEGRGQGAIDILTGKPVNTSSSNARYKVGNQNYDEEGNPVDEKPSSGRTPEEQTAYERAINKLTSDAKTRTTLNYVTNLDKTRQSINPDDLVRYSGLKGTGNWLRDSFQSAMGNTSPEYQAHQDAMTASNLMIDQMRQFYGDSIQPAAMDRLKHLANPSTWYKDPKVAKQQWEQLNKILDNETQTYKDNGTSPIKLRKVDFKDGKFVLGDAPKTNKASSNTQKASSNDDNATSSYDLKKVIPKLMAIDPNNTEENIKDTAKTMKMTVDQVIQALLKRSANKGK